MMDILQFIFSSFWTFLGCMILLGIAVRGIVALAAIAQGATGHWGS